MKINRILKKLNMPLSAMMTLEAAYIVPVFFLIIFGATGIAVNLYTAVRAEAEDIEDNNKIDAVKNFRYASMGQGLINSLGGDAD